MKTILFTILILPAAALAHCPIELEINGDKYCTNVKWLASDTKVQGQYQESFSLSPYLIPAGEVPPKWAYSKAEFLIWKKGDGKHKPQNPKDFRIFPYMMMESGAHHSAGYTFGYDQNSETFIIQHLALQSMKGCWSLRWTTSSTDEIATSQHLANVVEYSNLNTSDNDTMTTYCKNLIADDAPVDDNHNGHEHHH